MNKGNKHKEPDTPFDNMTYDSNRCFLCGDLLTDKNRTQEHIYPLWLQHKYNLANQRLTLLNGTSIKYKNLKIPCCKRCNGIMGSKIERPMERAVNRGYEGVKNIDPYIIFQWANKLSYGLFYKELSLLNDVRDPDGDTIFDNELIAEFKTRYVFLNSIISETQFANKPFSLLIFKLRPDEYFDYWGFDGYEEPVFCMYFGEVGIIIHFEDCGYNEGYFKSINEMNDLLERELCLIQFKEVFAKFLYKSSLFQLSIPSITIFDNNTPKLFLFTGVTLNGCLEWNTERYAKILASCIREWGIAFSEIYDGKNKKVRTFLFDEDGQFIDEPIQIIQE